MSLWDWSRLVWNRPGVEVALLELQDGHGQSVPLLLWAAWAAGEGRALNGPVLRRGAELAQVWERNATGPLRQTRRALKAPRADIDPPRQEALRGEVKAVELDAERLLLDSLEALSPGEGGHACDMAGALQAASGAMGRPAPGGAIRRLAEVIEAGAKVRTLRVVRAPEAEPESLSANDGSASNRDDAVRARLSALRTEHQDLDNAITALASGPLPDVIQMARLKKKKLTLRDEIAALEAQLPDIIA